MKNHVYDPKVVAQVNILKIIRLMEHHQINSFLKVSTNYNEDLIRVFYFGLGSKDESTFKFKMGKSTFMVTEDLWNELFDITVLCRDPTMIDHELYKDFD